MKWVVPNNVLESGVPKIVGSYETDIQSQLGHFWFHAHTVIVVVSRMVRMHAEMELHDKDMCKIILIALCVQSSAYMYIILYVCNGCSCYAQSNFATHSIVRRRWHRRNGNTTAMACLLYSNSRWHFFFDEFEVWICFLQFSKANMVYHSIPVCCVWVLHLSSIMNTLAFRHIRTECQPFSCN